MYFDNVIKMLLENSCPSRKFRIRRELLNEPVNSAENTKLQSEILKDEKVKEVLSWQKPDGWLGGKFHSGCDPETGVRVLTEKGILGENYIIRKALNVFKEREDTFDDGCLYKVGKILDQKHFGGSKMIRAVVFAYAGVEDEDLVQKEISEAIDGFRFVLSVNSIDEVALKYKNNILVFKDNMKWPSVYHLRLLAFTKNWRSSENTDIILGAMKKLVNLSPIPEVKILYKSQVISPASAFMNDFNPKLEDLSAQDWMMWFHRMEMLARIGIINDIPELKKQVDYLKDYLIQNEGLFKLPLSHYYFHKWNMYVGLALEKNWRKSMARICDLTFRSLLILNYSGNLADLLN